MWRLSWDKLKRKVCDVQTYVEWVNPCSLIHAHWEQYWESMLIDSTNQCFFLGIIGLINGLIKALFVHVGIIDVKSIQLQLGNLDIKESNFS